MGQDIPAIQAISDIDRLSLQQVDDTMRRLMADGVEDEHQRTWTGSTKGYPNMQIEAVFDSPVKEMSPHKDLTGYSRVVFGQGCSQIEACVTSGHLVLRAPPASRLVIEPLNSGSVRIIAHPL